MGIVKRMQLEEQERYLAEHDPDEEWEWEQQEELNWAIAELKREGKWDAMWENVRRKLHGTTER